MKIVGIIPAKANSNRFPGKNNYLINRKPMFLHNWELLNNCPLVNMTYIATDSLDVRRYFHHLPLAIIDRRANISKDDQPIFDVIKYAYYCLNERYDIIISILANTINHTQSAVIEALEMIINTNLDEVRSYDENGIENGILAFREKVLLKHEISAYMGMIISPGKEIHYKEELRDYL